jgi:hypothetical protein
LRFVFANLFAATPGAHGRQADTPRKEALRAADVREGEPREGEPLPALAR